MQAATVIRSVPTLLNIPPATLRRRLKLLAYGLLPWSTTHAHLKPSVLGRLLTTPDSRLMRLSYLAFLHGFASPQPMGTDSDSGDTAQIQGQSTSPEQSSERDCADASVADAPKRISISRHAGRGSPSKGATGPGSGPLAQAKGGKGLGGTVGAGASAMQGLHATYDAASAIGQCLKAPLSFTIMPEDEFLTKYPRFTRWLRRKNRSLSVLSVRSL